MDRKGAWVRRAGQVREMCGWAVQVRGHQQSENAVSVGRGALGCVRGAT